MKFELLARSEEEAEKIYDQLASAMKMHRWNEPIVIYSDMPDFRKPDEVTYWVRVGNWSNPAQGEVVKPLPEQRSKLTIAGLLQPSAKRSESQN